MQKTTIILCFICILFTACLSSKQSGPDNSVLEHNKKVAEATARVDSSIERLNSYSERLDSCEGTVEELIELFDNYNRGVEQLKQDYYYLRDILETQEQRFDTTDLRDYY